MSTTRESADTQRAGDDPAADTMPKPLWQDAFNLPNTITLSRLLLAVVLFALIYMEGFWLTSAILFIFAASTDFLDGYFARKYGMITVLGRIMDPFVDKIIVGGAFVFLAAKPESGINAWMAIIVLGREMFVTSLRGYLEQQGLDFSASWSGKLKMFLQCAAVPLAIGSLDERFQQDWYLLTRDIVLWAAVGMTIFSGLVYVVRATRILKPKSDSGAS